MAARASACSQALPAGDGSYVCGGDTLHLGPVCGFTVAGITCDHAVLVQEVQVSFSACVSAHLPSARSRLDLTISTSQTSLSIRVRLTSISRNCFTTSMLVMQ